MLAFSIFWIHLCGFNRTFDLMKGWRLNRYVPSTGFCACLYVRTLSQNRIHTKSEPEPIQLSLRKKNCYRPFKSRVATRWFSMRLVNCLAFSKYQRNQLVATSFQLQKYFIVVYVVRVIRYNWPSLLQKLNCAIWRYLLLKL